MNLIADPPSLPRNDSELLRHFESLGFNCEFGLVQRAAAVEMIGLFRFNQTSYNALLHGIETGFADLALPGQVEVKWTGEWQVTESVYGFRYHTFNHDKSLDPAQLIKEHSGWLRYTAEKFLEQLETADRIFVRKGETPEQEAEIRALHAAMRRYGKTQLLWVCEADETHQAGDMEWLEDGLMRGWIEAFAPRHRANDGYPPDWLLVCRRAWALGYLGNADALPQYGERRAPGLEFGGWSGSDLATAERSWQVPPPPGGGKIMRHRLISDAAEPQGIFGCLVTGLRPGGLYFASVDIRLPADFSGNTVALNIAGATPGLRSTLEYKRRGIWQQKWVSGVLPARATRTTLRLLVAAPAGTVLYSANWKLEHVAVPPA